VLVTSGSTLDQAVINGELIEVCNCIPVTKTSTPGTATAVPIEDVIENLLHLQVYLYQ
jgi:hypothetical protein